MNKSNSVGNQIRRSSLQKNWHRCSAGRPRVRFRRRNLGPLTQAVPCWAVLPSIATASATNAMIGTLTVILTLTILHPVVPYVLHAAAPRSKFADFGTDLRWFSHV
jgi:hypothetical protein